MKLFSCGRANKIINRILIQSNSGTARKSRGHLLWHIKYGTVELSGRAFDKPNYEILISCSQFVEHLFENPFFCSHILHLGHHKINILSIITIIIMEIKVIIAHWTVLLSCSYLSTVIRNADFFFQFCFDYGKRLNNIFKRNDINHKLVYWYNPLLIPLSAWFCHMLFFSKPKVCWYHMAG